ncbi:hypothetical protein T492DRAFT_988454 [Pavlovales sp. CCMP2436]|nr:hypothetical protein T492DRAFT_988454 [Pavlovales sp. CCMP2436]
MPVRPPARAPTADSVDVGLPALSRARQLHAGGARAGVAPAHEPRVRPGAPPGQGRPRDQHAARGRVGDQQQRRCAVLALVAARLAEPAACSWRGRAGPGAAARGVPRLPRQRAQGGLDCGQAEPRGQGGSGEWAALAAFVHLFVRRALAALARAASGRAGRRTERRGGALAAELHVRGHRGPTARPLFSPQAAGGRGACTVRAERLRVRLAPPRLGAREREHAQPGRLGLEPRARRAGRAGVAHDQPAAHRRLARAHAGGASDARLAHRRGAGARARALGAARGQAGGLRRLGRQPRGPPLARRHAARHYPRARGRGGRRRARRARGRAGARACRGAGALLLPAHRLRRPLVRARAGRLLPAHGQAGHGTLAPAARIGRVELGGVPGALLRRVAAHLLHPLGRVGQGEARVPPQPPL